MTSFLVFYCTEDCVLDDHFSEFWGDVIVLYHVEVGGELVSDGLNRVDEILNFNVIDCVCLKVFDGEFPLWVVYVDECLFDGFFVCV